MRECVSAIREARGKLLGVKLRGWRDDELDPPLPDGKPRTRGMGGYREATASRSEGSCATWSSRR
jgi:hypothetical protein